jgi:hypothetical protein
MTVNDGGVEAWQTYIGESCERAFWRNGPIIRLKVYRYLDLLDITPWFEMPVWVRSLARSKKKAQIFDRRKNSLVSLFVQRWPILNTTKEAADMDQIKTLWGVHPFICRIFHLEPAIWRHKRWLYRRKVCP